VAVAAHPHFGMKALQATDLAIICTPGRLDHIGHIQLVYVFGAVKADRAETAADRVKQLGRRVPIMGGPDQTTDDLDAAISLGKPISRYDAFFDRSTGLRHGL
jgi:hypothetical protein